MSTEKMTCPRRSEGPGWDVKESDRWRDDNWGPNDRWQWSWQPRTCSYCGGVHPEDAIKLLGEGWENEFSTKAYKGYLNPPGTAQKDATILHRLRKDGDLSVAPSVWSPTPPVKLYTMHFDADQMARLNMAIVGARR